MPYVSVEGYDGTEGIYSILADYRGSVEMALDYMLPGDPAGTTAPVYAEVFHSSAGNRAIWAEKNRRDAYTDWCNLHGMEPSISRHEEREGRVEWQEWLSQLREAGGELPPVLVNWSSAVPDLYRAAHRLNLQIGKDLRIMAADNTIQGHRLSLPSLSCVEIPYVSMGEEAVRCVLKQIEQGPETPGKLWLPALLRPGESA
ncbi:hypothetical protein D3C81_1293370 [compost metagenome]